MHHAMAEAGLAHERSVIEDHAANIEPAQEVLIFQQGAVAAAVLMS